MSVLIRKMEMPKRCETCQFWKPLDMDLRTLKVQPYCYLTSTPILGNGNARLDNCPLIEVPTPHGRLIDADELEVDTEWSDYYDDYQSYSAMQIKYAPTVIEREE